MSQWADIRHLHLVDGVPKKEIARRLKLDVKTVRGPSAGRRRRCGCKHAAAVLYGVGGRLDDRPELLFRLRDVDAEDLVVGDMALPDAAAGDDVLAGDLADIFGIDLDPRTAARRPLGRRPPDAAGPAAGGRVGPAPRRPGSSLRAAGWRSCAAGADSRSPSSPACSAYPRRRCTAGKRPAGRSPSEPVRRTPCRCCTGKSRNARLSDWRRLVWFRGIDIKLST